jgi:hypothetical protein
VTPPTRGAGSVVWAVSGFDIKQPFRVLEHDGTEARVADAEELARRVQRRELAGAFELVVGAKLRPVILLQERPVGRFADFAALRLTRLEKFAPDEQQRIRDGEEETLFHLGHNKAKYGMDKEYAVILTSLHRVHRDAIATRAVGAVDRAELRTIGERLVKVTDLDLANLIVRQAGELVARLKQPPPKP